MEPIMNQTSVDQVMEPVYKAGWNDEHKLIMKIAEVMTKVEYLQKKGKNNFHGYTYATEADVNMAIREEIAQRKVIMIPSMVNHSLREVTTRKGNVEYIARATLAFTFMDGETGEQLTLYMSGEGQDVGDKCLYKAISGTQKYALMKFFMIPTGDDPEKEEADPEPETPKRKQDSAPMPVTLSPEQFGHIKIKILELVGYGGTEEAVRESLLRKIKTEFKVEYADIAQLPATAFQFVTETLDSWIAMKQQKPAK